MSAAMRRIAMPAAIAALAAVALAACGGSNTTTTVTASPTTQASAPTQTVTSTPTQTATSATTTTSSGGGNGAAGGTGKLHIAVYKPSTTVRHDGFVTVITSPDSVTKVADFYKAQLAKGGWNIRESSVNSFHAVFNATRGNEGATIVVHPQGQSGSGATITEHPG
jgi:hypothetical protein